MRNFFFLAKNYPNPDIFKPSASLFFAAIFVVLAGCGSGSGLQSTTSGTSSGTAGTTTGTTGTTVTTSGPTLTLALTNSAGVTIHAIPSGAPAPVKATLKNAAGAVVPNAVVTFSTEAALATIAPSATALTDASGVATITLSAASILSAGATTVNASSQVGTDAASASIGFTVGNAAVIVTAPGLGVGAAALSAFGTTSIDVSVSVGGVAVTTPQNVTFSSICANAGKAVLSTGAVTGAGGVARGSYRDNGCAGTDIITATAAGVTSASTSLVVTPPTTGSIQFVSAAPGSLSLKGIGGTEASQVSFKVLDAGGQPLSGKTVTFGLSTTVGGITLVPSVAGVGTATSDANGLVVITVNSGTVSTPVRVTATTIDTSVLPNVTLTTQSSGLTISTGIPDDDSFSLSASKLNPEFWEIDGNTTVLTVRLADHFNNPVPNGTVVNFTTEGGSIVASCSTVIDSNGNSNCSSTLTSQAPRPADGRVTVMAYALGEESFIDLNGNGVADVADLVPNEITDLPEAFRDDSENGTRDANETFIDFNQNSAYDGPDGKYSGVLCDSAKSSPGTCSANKTINVSKNIVIVFSGSTPFISKIAPAGTVNLVGGCTGTSVQVDLRIVDVNGNPLPVGTTIAVTTTDGTISGAASFVQDNTNVAPAAGGANYSVSLRDDGVNANLLDPNTGLVVGTTCTDSTLSGVLTVTVTPPSGVARIVEFPVSN